MSEKNINLGLKIKALVCYLRRFLINYWLLISLIVIFVLQNYLFNIWLKIPIHPYFIRSSIVTAALGLLLFGPSLLLSKKFKYFYLSIVSFLVALIFCIQFLYYSYSGGFLQASALFYAGEGLTVLDTVKILLTYHLIFFATGLLLVFIAWFLTSRKTIVEKTLVLKEKFIAAILILVCAVAGYGYLFAREYAESGNIAGLYQYNKVYDFNRMVSKLGIVNFSIGDLLTLGFSANTVNAADISFVNNYKKQQATASPGFDFGLLKGRNLIFIQVESLENAVINQKIYGQEITPNLNRLANQGLYFSNYYSPVGPGTTADAEFMTLNSLYALPDTVAFIQYAYDHYTALPSLLKENGYHTYSFHGDVPSFWNRANIYPQLGYEEWFSRKDYVIPRDIGAFDLGDKDFFEQSIPKMKSLPQPFMATLITLSSHTAFQLPADLETLDLPATSTLSWLQQQYLQSIHYTDQAIGDFVNQLKIAGLYNNSLIFIFGDHGSFTDISDALGVKESIFPNMQASQVPLIILAPGTSLKGERNTPGMHVDVYPTVADLLGFNLPSSIFGHDLITGENAVAINRNLISGTVNTVLTSKLAYHASDDGVFGDGTCLEVPSDKKLTASACQSLYSQEEEAVQASDLMVRGNLIGTN